MALEIETKFHVKSPEIFDKIRAEKRVASYALVDKQVILQCDTYFDSPAGLLFHRGVSLRLREKGGEYLVTFKSQVKGNQVRTEIEMSITTSQAQKLLRGDFMSVRCEAIQAAMSYVETQAMVPVLSVENNREAWFINSEAGRVEICFDDVQYTKPDCSQCQYVKEYELELELKEGEDTFLQELTHALSQQCDLVPNLQSKYERGVRILNVFSNAN